MSVQQSHLPKDTMDKFSKWKKFVIVKGYRPRERIYEQTAKKAGMTEAEKTAEIELGLWEKDILRSIRENRDNASDWQPLDQMQKEFIKIWKEATVYRLNKLAGQNHTTQNHAPIFPAQKHNPDRLINRFKEFFARKFYKPNAAASKKTAKVDASQKRQTAASFPQNKSVKCTILSPEQNTDKLNKLKEFVARNGHKPRTAIRMIEAVEVGLTEAERIEEIQLGKWASDVVRGDLSVNWQDPAHRRDFIKLWNDIPTLIQKNNLVSFNEWKEFVAHYGYLPRTKVKAEKNSIAEPELLKENILGRWAQYASCKSGCWQDSSQEAEFKRIKNTAMSYTQKDTAAKFNKWKEFVLTKGYKPRGEIYTAEKMGMTESEQQEENTLGLWARRFIRSVKRKTQSQQQLDLIQTEFMKIWSKPPRIKPYKFVVRQSDTTNFNRLRDFIARKGYKPRSVVCKVVAQKQGLTETERQEEARLGQWALRVTRRGLECPEQQAEFDKFWKETPGYLQKNNADNLNKVKEFIARQGYYPRHAVISKRAVEKASVAEIEKLLEETRLRKWLYNISKCPNPEWQYPEQQAEFNRIWGEAPAYSRKKYFQEYATDKLNRLKEFIARNGCKPRAMIAKAAAEEAGLTESERRNEVVLGRWLNSAKQKKLGISGTTGGVY